MKRLGTLLVLMAAAGCGHEFEPPDRAERVAEAAAEYSPAIFDSISWPADSARAIAGSTVYAEKCRRCHGTMGEGGTEYAATRDLDVPTLVSEEWDHESIEELRRLVFVGHEEGMPGYGIAGITPRDIDASVFYVQYRLRPEVLNKR